MGLSQGLACKVSGFRVGFVLSKSEEQKLENLRIAMQDASKQVRRGSTLVSTGLGAVAVGLVANAFAKRRER